MISRPCLGYYNERNLGLLATHFESQIRMEYHTLEGLHRTARIVFLFWSPSPLRPWSTHCKAGNNAAAVPVDCRRIDALCLNKDWIEGVRETGGSYGTPVMWSRSGHYPFLRGGMER